MVTPQVPILASFYIVQKFVLNVQLCFITPLHTPIWGVIFSGKRIRVYLRRAGDPTESRRQNSLQHPRPLQRRLHAGHLHPRHQEDAEGRRPEDGQLHGPNDVKSTEKERGSTEQISSVLPQIF